MFHFAIRLTPVALFFFVYRIIHSFDVEFFFQNIEHYEHIKWSFIEGICNAIYWIHLRYIDGTWMLCFNFGNWVYKLKVGFICVFIDVFFPRVNKKSWNCVVGLRATVLWHAQQLFKCAAAAALKFKFILIRYIKLWWPSNEWRGSIFIILIVEMLIDFNSLPFIQSIPFECTSKYVQCINRMRTSYHIEVQICARIGF